MARHKTIRQREAALDLRLQSLGICNLDMGGDAPAPDPNIGIAAANNAALGKEQLEWVKQIYGETAPQREEATKIALDQARTQVETAKKQNDMADETYAYTKETFRPLEQKIAADALGYDTAERRDAEAAQAQADIGSAGDATRATLAREVASRGGDVNSGNFTASLANFGVREAAAKAGAGNTARKNVEAVGAAKVADAAALGRGIASTNATQTQLGLQAGNSAVGNAQVPGNITNQQVAGMNSATQTAMNGNSSSGNLLLGQYNAQNSASNKTSLGDIAALGQAGAALFALSDKKQKTGRKKVKPSLSMDGIRKTTVESWKYKNSSPANDGGRRHTGAMAQSIRKNLGDDTAPGGKVVDLISLSGHQMNAIKDLDKRLMRLEDAKPRSKAK